MNTGLILLFVGVGLTLTGCALCGGWADRHSIRPFIVLTSVGLVAVVVGYFIILWGASR